MRECQRQCRLESAEAARELLDKLVAMGVGHWEETPPGGKGRPPSPVFVMGDNSVEPTGGAKVD